MPKPAETVPYLDEQAWSVALETSTRAGSVALGRGSSMVAMQHLSGLRRHGGEFVQTLRTLCAAHGCPPSDLRRVYVSIGPGSFTGLRLGVTVARMIALGCNASMVAVPSMEVIASNALACADRPDRVVVLLDARRKHVFGAVCVLKEGNYRLIQGPIEADPAEYLAQLDRHCALMGEGVGCHREFIERTRCRVLPESTWQPHADAVFAIGERLASCGSFTPAKELVPLYVRVPDAEEKWAKRELDNH